MSVNASLLKQLIEEIVLEELPSSSQPNPLLAQDPNQPPQNMKPEEFEKFFRNLIRRRNGQANLNRSDIEKLDYITRWMQYVPGGTRYRRGLAKYLRSKRDKVRKDPFRDFRRYQYNQDDIE